MEGVRFVGFVLVHANTRHLRRRPLSARLGLLYSQDRTSNSNAIKVEEITVAEGARLMIAMLREAAEEQNTGG